MQLVFPLVLGLATAFLVHYFIFGGEQSLICKKNESFYNWLAITIPNDAFYKTSEQSFSLNDTLTNQREYKIFGIYIGDSKENFPDYDLLTRVNSAELLPRGFLPKTIVLVERYSSKIGDKVNLRSGERRSVNVGNFGFHVYRIISEKFPYQYQLCYSQRGGDATSDIYEIIEKCEYIQ
jgi:hypothetical protein